MGHGKLTIYIQLVIARFLPKTHRKYQGLVSAPSYTKLFFQPMIITPKPPNFSDKKNWHLFSCRGRRCCRQIAWHKGLRNDTFPPKKDFTITKSVEKPKESGFSTFFKMILLSTYLLLHNLIPVFKCQHCANVPCCQGPSAGCLFFHFAW